jgi:hypothetical protein
VNDGRVARRSAADAATVLVALALCSVGSAHAQVRARAEVTCRPAGEKLHYDCLVKLANARTGEPLSGMRLTVGASMPSMPAAHNVRPVVATEDQVKGTYQARIVLEMHGDWALQLDLSGAARDRVVKLLRFESDRVNEPSAAPGRHRH